MILNISVGKTGYKPADTQNSRLSKVCCTLNDRSEIRSVRIAVSYGQTTNQAALTGTSLLISIFMLQMWRQTTYESVRTLAFGFSAQAAAADCTQDDKMFVKCGRVLLRHNCSHFAQLCSVHGHHHLAHLRPFLGASMRARARCKSERNSFVIFGLGRAEFMSSGQERT
jgi:hypothetical protein